MTVFTKGPGVRWQNRAACVDEDLELFFPPGYSDGYFTVVREAKRVCGRCPVYRSCLDFAVSTNQTDGVWGGLTPDERNRLMRRRRRRTPGAVTRIDDGHAS